MKNLPLNDRPREKLLRHGAGAVGDNELVAIVWGTGSKQAGALEVANTLLRIRGGLHGVARSSCDDLTRVNGIGEARAARIIAAVELGRRTLMNAPSARVQIRSPRDAAQF